MSRESKTRRTQKYLDAIDWIALSDRTDAALESCDAVQLVATVFRVRVAWIVEDVRAMRRTFAKAVGDG